MVHAEKLRNLGMVLVLAILASFAVAIPSASAATVSTVFPESGPNIGGTSVTVTGSGFGTTGTPTVTVGGNPATSVARQSDSQITFVTPAGEGVSDIVITPSVGEPVTVTGGFTYDSYLITPVIETINTPTVGQTGGEVITITGRYLNYVTSLTVGDSYYISWENFQTRDSADGKYISFISPYQSTPGPKDIKFYGGDQTVTEFAGVTYLAPEITKITPNTGPTGGTTAVVIDGVGFSSLGTLTVTAGGVAATAVTRVSPTQIKATFPANTAGLKDVVVTLYNAGSAPTVYPITKTGGFLYIEASSAPTLTAVLPAKGSTAGGNTVTVYGTNLRGTDGNAATITFDGIPATNVVVAVDRKSATVTVPAHAAGAVTVAVQTTNGSAAKPSAYTYAVAPTITSIVPNSGVVPGGTAITINGTNFGSGNPVVTVGGQPALCTRLVSPTQIEAVTPAGTAGAVNVVVDPGTGVGSATSTNGYTYVAATSSPVISSISPSSGLVTGGTSITITTTGAFPAGTPTVLIGNICATNVTRVSSTVVTAVTPVGTVGAKDLSVTFGTSYSSSVGGFTYSAAPAVSSVSPARGGTTGNTAVTITGVGFGNSGTPTVTFGGVSATSIVRVNDTTITAVTPPNSSGAKAVVVTPSGGSAITKASAFTYDLPTITLITPNSGPTTGGNRVIIDGTGFGHTGTPTVTFGGRAATDVVRVSATRVLATTPLGVAGKPTVIVTPAVGTGSASTTTLFTYLLKRITPVITSQSPSWVSASGGTRVYITGANFRSPDGTPAVVKVDGVTMTGVVVSADGTSLSFVSTAMSAGWHTAAIETGEGIATHVGMRVAYPASFGGGGDNVCNAVSPWSWNPAGGTAVTVTGSDFGADAGLPTVLVDGVEADVTNFTDTLLQFTDPGGPLGHADIEITFANANEASFDNCVYRQGTATITANDKTINYGDVTPTFTRTVTGLLGTDALTGLTYTFIGTEGTSYGPSTTAPTAAGVYRIVPSNGVVTPGSISNYDVTYVEGTFTINGIPATVTASDKSKQYGAADPTFTSAATGLITGHSLTGVTYVFEGIGGTSYGPSTTVPTGVGTYSISPSDAEVTGGAEVNYSFTYVDATYTITPRAITVTADDQSKEYGQDDPELTYTITSGSLVDGESLNGWLTRNGGEDVGTYSINVGYLDSWNPNYDITFVGGDLTITAKSITVTADDKSKGYGEGDPELTYSSAGLIGEDQLSGSLTRATGEAVGNYAITQGTLTGGSNYVITSFTPGNLDITPRAVQLTIDSQNMVYGDNLPTNSFSITDGGLAEGDLISSLTYGYSTGTYDVGEHTIDGSNPVFASGSASNYDFTILSGTLTVTPRPITITADDKEKTYGDNDPAFTYSITSGNLVGSDSFSGSLSRDEGDGVGEYDITVGTLSAGSNYEVTVNGGTLTINPRPITITADAKTMTYGDNEPTATWQLTSGTLVGGDSLVGWLGRADGNNAGTYAYNIGVVDEYNPSYNITFVSANLTIEPKEISVTIDDVSKYYGDEDPTFTYSSSGLLDGDYLTGSATRVSGEDAGNYTISEGTLGGGTNYILTGVTAGTLTIDPRGLEIWVDSASMDYGDSLPTNGIGGINGLIGDDSVSSLTYSYSSTPTNVGEYGIEGSSPVFSSGSASNYSITIYDGTLTVNPRAVTVTADDLSKQYGDNDPALTWTVTSGNFVNGDGTTGSLARTEGEGAGDYPISAGSLSAGSNYNLTVVDGTFTITQRPITITADPKSKTYGDADPTPTFQVTTGSLVSGDTLVGDLGRDPGEDAGTYAYNIGVVGEYNPSYDITFVSDNLTIGAKSITVTLDDNSKTYGEVDPTFTYSSTGLLDGDSLVGEPTRVAGDDAGQYDITAGTLTGGDNYTITSITPGTFTINTREITITADNQSMAYGDNVPSNNFSITNGSLAYSDSISGLDYTYSSAVNGVGDYGISPSNATFSIGNSLNYAITYADGTLTVTPLDITLSVSNEFIIYGESDPIWNVQVTGGYWVGGDGYTGTPERDPGTDVGTYTIRQGTVDAGPNYNLTFNEGLLTVDQASLTIDADSQLKTYGDADPELTYSIWAGTLHYGDQLSGSLAREMGEDAGQYLIGQGTLDNPNYDILFTSDYLTIDPKPITVTVSSAFKYYGDDDPVFEATADGLINGDQLSGTITRDSGDTVGSYALDAAGISAGTNYIISSPIINYLTIDPRPITVTMDDASKTYGDSEPFAWGWTVTDGSLVFGDQPTGDGTRDAGEDAGTYSINSGTLDFGTNYTVTYNTGTFTIDPIQLEVTAVDAEKMYGDNDPVSAYTVTAGQLIGLDEITGTLDREAGDTPGTYDYTLGTLDAGTNYSITIVAGALTVTNRPLTVDPDDVTKVYGQDDPGFTYAITSGSLINGDELSGSLGRDGGENVGTYAITAGDLANSYYDITVLTGELSITAKDITVTVDNASKFYGESDPVLTASSNDLEFEDSLSGTPLRASGETVGDYTIGQGTVSAGSNYTIVTFNDGTFTINAAPITVTMDNSNKEYGTTDPVSFGYSVTSGALVGEDQPTGSPTRVSGENIGTYDIEPGTLAFGSNYDVTYINGTFTIDPIAIVLTADDVEKEYGADDPGFTYTVTSGTIADGDTLTGSLARDVGEDVGEYAITPGTLSAGPNYEVTILSGSLTIVPREITVTADDDSKTFGDDDPTFTWSVTTGSLVGEDTLSGSLDRDAGEDVGTYPITQGSLSNSNYDITFVPGAFDIERLSIAVVVDDVEKNYGDDDPTFTYTVDGVGGVELSGSLTRDAGEDVGTWDITQGTLSGGDNYTISSFTAGTLTIVQRPITIVIDDDTMTFGDSVPTPTFSVEEGGLVGSDEIASVAVAYSDTVAGVGDYGVAGSSATFGSGNPNNYFISFTSGTLTVQPKPVTLTLDDIESAWGATIPDVTWTTADLEGSDSVGGLDVTFDGDPSAPVLPGEYAIAGLTPTMETGDAANYDFTVVPATLTITGPEFLAIDPPEGFVTGGFPFQITGTGFGTETPTVQFDGIDATDVVLVDSSTITGITPEHAEGPVTVTIITTEETLELPEAYTYIPIPPAPEVFTMFPPEGPTAGGTLVTFSGANLFNVDGTPGQVTFDGIDGTAEAISEDGVTLTVRTPEHVIDTVDVVITTDGGIITMPESFTYFEGPVGDISGKLWIDTNFDGQLQPTESMLPNTELAIVREGALDPELPSTIPAPNRLSAAYRATLSDPRVAAIGVETYYWVGSSDANGNYEVPQLPYGHYVLVYTLPADFQETVGGGTPGAVSIVLSTPQLEQDLAGAGNSELILNQIVLRSSGDPVPYAEARLRWSGSDGELETEDDVIFPVLADENGQFTVEGLVSGEYDVITYDDDPLTIAPKVVVLDAFSSIDGEIWELVDREDGALAETGFDLRAMSSIAAGLLALGAIALGARRRRHSTTV